AIKFGPMAAAFKGNATLERRDDDRVATLRGEGVDSLSNSRARGDVTYAIVEKDDHQCRVNVSLAYSLQGPLAQFSRSGLVRAFVKRMIADFGDRKSTRLNSSHVKNSYAVFCLKKKTQEVILTLALSTRLGIE